MSTEEVVRKEMYLSLEETPGFLEAVARCQSADDDLALAREGTSLWKVRSYSKWYQRKFVLDHADGVLRYEPTHKAICTGHPKFIDIADIVDVRKGWKTDTFNKFGNKVVGEQRKRRLKKLRKMSEQSSSSGAGAGVAEVPDDRGVREASPVKPLVDEACCFSIVYSAHESSSERATLDLVAATPQLAALWVRALRHLVTVLRGMRQEERFNKWLSQQFAIADRDRSGSLVFDECLRLLHQLNVTMSRREAMRLFELANTDKREIDGQPALDAKEFVAFFQMLMKRPEVEEIYHKYARSALEMTAGELLNFLSKEQHMKDVTLDDCNSLIDAFEQSELKAAGRISINGFTNLLLSEQFEIMATSQRAVFQDMTQPLSNYFIASSHNTYLMGRQVVAESTIEGYVDALRRGCRCLELDCWDGPEGEPVVTHGYALTSKIMFRDVLIDAILPNAFLVSEYPVILSLENHCTAEQQQRLASHITDVFGELLYTDEVSPDMEELPSPEELKRKIIIKGRKAARQDTDDSSSESEDEGLVTNGSTFPGPGQDSSSDSEGPLTATTPTTAPLSPPSLYPAVPHATSPTAPQRMKHRSSSRKSRSSRMSNGSAVAAGDLKLLRVTDQNLSDLVNICQSVHFHGFEHEGRCYEMVSFAEGKALQIADRSPEKLINFNCRRLSRIYPSGTRASSSNFKPFPYWNTGCQLVALNYQSNKKPVFFNEALFRTNGGCGFVLKPDFLRLPDVAKYRYDPNTVHRSKLGALRDRRRVLDIRIISGQHLPKPEGDDEVVDPYVKVKIVGHPVDKGKSQTRAIEDNGFNPRWNAPFRFDVHVPELAFLYFIVKDKTPRRQDPILGCYALPFSSIAPGYRHVPLMDTKRRSLSPASLFVHIKITDSAS